MITCQNMHQWCTVGSFDDFRTFIRRTIRVRGTHCRMSSWDERMQTMAGFQNQDRTDENIGQGFGQSPHERRYGWRQRPVLVPDAATPEQTITSREHIDEEKREKSLTVW